MGGARDPYTGEPLVFGLLTSSPLCRHSFSRFLWPPALSTWTVHLVSLTRTRTAGGVCSSAGQCPTDSQPLPRPRPWPLTLNPDSGVSQSPILSSTLGTSVSPEHT